MIYYLGKESLFDDSSMFKRVSMQDLLDWLQAKTSVGVDTETEGFLDFKNKVIMLQIGDKTDQFVVDTRCTDVSSLKVHLENPKLEKLFWNAKFDVSMLRFTFGWRVEGIYDGFLAECILTTGLIGPDRSLEGAVMKYCKHQLNKAERSKFVGLRGSAYTHTQIKYGAEDVEYLHTIKDIQTDLIKQYDMANTLKLENAFVSVLADVEYNGFKLDSNKWKALSEVNKSKYLESKETLEQYVLSNSTLAKYKDNQLDMFSDASTTSIEWSSPMQVIEVMKTLGVDTRVVDKKTGKEKSSVEAKHLNKFKGQFPIIKLYLDYKENEKLVNTYGDNFLSNINPITGRVHSNFWQILDTGRISSSNPNLQNIPSDSETRACFVAEDGNILTVADYSSQEPRVTADKCMDPSLVEFFLKGDGDMHSLVATKMYTVINGRETIVTKENENKHLRQIGKILGLKLDYGGSAWTVKDDLGVTEEEAQKFIDAYFAAFPGKKTYFNQCVKETLDNGFILINKVTNRRSWCDNFEWIRDCKKNYSSLSREERSRYFKYKGSLERNAQNYCIQGTAADMTKTACVLIDRQLGCLGLREVIKIVGLVHDEIITEEPIEYKDIAEKLIKKAMLQAGEVFCKTVPMKVEPTSNLFWQK